MTVLQLNDTITIYERAEARYEALELRHRSSGNIELAEFYKKKKNKASDKADYYFSLLKSKSSNI